MKRRYEYEDLQPVIDKLLQDNIGDYKMLLR